MSCSDLVPGTAHVFPPVCRWMPQNQIFMGLLQVGVNKPVQISRHYRDKRFLKETLAESNIMYVPGIAKQKPWMSLMVTEEIDFTF